MEPKFQTSFIPKSPVISAAGPKVSAMRGGTNIFSVIATIFFIVTLVVSGGLFIYKRMLQSQIAAADTSLTAAREAFQPEKIQELIDANSRITAARGLLNKHIAVSGLLTLLQSLTVKNLRFDNLVYMNAAGKGPTLSMDAEAQNYNALAEQENIFAGNEFLRNEAFSNFTLSDNGTVKAQFFANLDPGLVSYKKLFDTGANTTTQ